jgi:DNA ligase-1
VGASLLDFTAANDLAAATPKKLAKQAALGAYFRSIEADDDLRRAVRFAAGRPFASTDERTLSVGGAIVGDVVVAMLSLEYAEYRTLVIKHGEIGEAVAAAWGRRSSMAFGDPVGLDELSEAFDAIAATGNVEQKKSLLAELFDQCTNAREAAYLAKIISGDLRTGVQEGVLQAAIATAFDKPLAAIQRAQLLVGDLDEVAVLARHDRLATGVFRLFHPVQFMLATPQETAGIAAATLDGRTFYAEDKLDGIRAQVHKQGDRIAIYTRTMDRTDESFPDVVAAVSKWPGDFLIDGEIVPYRAGIVLPFAHIQKRLGRKVLTAKMLRDNPAVLIPFDILYRDGELLMDRPWVDRRAALDRMFAVESSNSTAVACVVADRPLPGESQPGSDLDRETIPAVPGGVTPPLRATPVTTAADITAAFDRSRQSRNEGLVLKDPQSIYAPGRRGKFWLKLKTHLPTFDCVVTAAEHGHGKRRDSLSDYTFAVWDRDPSLDDATLVNVGKAYSGVTDEEIAQLTQLFLQLSQGNDGRVHRVKPEVVLEIACDQIQKSARHASGFAMRFPRIKRIRWDKKPVDADRLERIAEVYQSTHNFGRVEDGPEESPEPTLFDGL